MFTLIVGGAASGKSEYAEQLAVQAGALPRYYIATMEPFDAECCARIARHRANRASRRLKPSNAIPGWMVCDSPSGAQSCWSA